MNERCRYTLLIEYAGDDELIEAIGQIAIERPAHTEGLEDLPQQVIVLDNKAELVAEQIRQHVTPNPA